MTSKNLFIIYGNVDMNVKKYHSGSEVMAQVRHDMRRLPDGRNSGNNDIKPELTKYNYSIVSRGTTCKEINGYRKELEKEIFHYKRKNIVHAVSWTIQKPDDCPAEQEEEFFKAAHDYIVSTLPMGERCVLVSEVHRDERRYDGTGNLLSKDHLHIMFVPAVPDTRHEGYKWRLCADQLTRRKQLRQMHPGFQKYLEERGIGGTVFHGKSGSYINLSIEQLKDLSDKGIIIDRKHPLTVDMINDLVKDGTLSREQVEKLQKQIDLNEQFQLDDAIAVSEMQKKVKDLQQTVDALQTENAEIRAERDEIQAKLTTVQRDDAIARSESQKAVKDLQQTIDALRTENAEIRAERDEFEARLTTVQHDVEEQKDLPFSQPLDVEISRHVRIDPLAEILKKSYERDKAREISHEFDHDMGIDV